MTHVLDNPVWNALNSGNNNLSTGNDKAKCFSDEVSPLAGMKENIPENFEALYDLIPFERYLIVVSPKEIAIPGNWKVINDLKVLQMICDKPVAQGSVKETIIPLTDEHIPAMLALTKLTAPGPFAQRTIDFGHYEGIFNGEQLVAMAGQRLHPYEYAEVSAVCTHPDFRGKGFVRQLIINQITRIRASSQIPYLHVKSDNARAIKVYTDLGFVPRKEMSFYVIKKN